LKIGPLGELSLLGVTTGFSPVSATNGSLYTPILAPDFISAYLYGAKLAWYSQCWGIYT